MDAIAKERIQQALAEVNSFNKRWPRFDRVRPNIDTAVTVATRSADVQGRIMMLPRQNILMSKSGSHQRFWQYGAAWIVAMFACAWPAVAACV